MFGRVGHLAWATCPLAENGVVRIIRNPRYPNTLKTPAAVPPLAGKLRVSWPHLLVCRPESARSGARRREPHPRDRPSDRHVPACLARLPQGALATFARRLLVDAVPDGARNLESLADAGAEEAW